MQLIFNRKTLVNKKLFRITVAIITFLTVIVVASSGNLRVDALNVNQIQTRKEVSQIQTLAQVPKNDPQEEVTPAREDTETDKKTNILLTSDSIQTLLYALIVGSLAVIITVFSPVIRTHEGRLEEKARFINVVLPKVVEGLTVILIVAIVTILSLVERINPEGAISILSALVGYVLGKQQGFMEAKDLETPKTSSQTNGRDASEKGNNIEPVSNLTTSPIEPQENNELNN